MTLSWNYELSNSIPLKSHLLYLVSLQSHLFKTTCASRFRYFSNCYMDPIKALHVYLPLCFYLVQLHSLIDLAVAFLISLHKYIDIEHTFRLPNISFNLGVLHPCPPLADYNPSVDLN